MDAFAAGASIAALALGYPGLSDLIVSDHLRPEQIYRLFHLNPPRRMCSQDLAIILAAGAYARYRACPQGWSGDEERLLAERALKRESVAREEVARGVPLQPRPGFAELAARAATMIGKSSA
jgi:hypothetical protein